MSDITMLAMNITLIVYWLSMLVRVQVNRESDKEKRKDFVDTIFYVLSDICLPLFMIFLASRSIFLILLAK